MEKCASGSWELELDAMALEDATSSDAESAELECWYCERGGRSGPCSCPPVGSCCCPPDGAPLPSCPFYSPRIKGLLVGERTEFETAREHWTVVDPESEAEAEQVAEENRKYFDEVLVTHPEWGPLFKRFEDLEVGAKIGEGGQAEIFEAKSKSFRRLGLVAKVFKEGVSLKVLEQQWPPQMLSEVAHEEHPIWPFKNIYGGAFIRDGELKNRFAFVMLRVWGDLRTCIDDRMLELLRKNSHGPPFRTILDVCNLIWETANDMRRMHEFGVVHRDIKASNVLLNGPLSDSFTLPLVIDFECSLGVIGTGFWRAPEILERVQKRLPTLDLVFTKKADIYSFGMMCYEIITGRIPFEEHLRNDYNIVLGGKRPELPHDLNSELKDLVHDCWQHDPQLRPTAREVVDRLYGLGMHLGLVLRTHNA